MLTFGSLFAGVGGFDLGFERAGMRQLFACEIDKTCNAVRRRHWPDEETFTDVTALTVRSTDRRPNVLCGGFPCQDVSVAGRRAGLDGARSGLWWEFARVIGEFAPEWVCIENVPGLLSSNGGRDMGAVLWSLGQLGYGWAYRVLDSQWFGVPQRRRRVFIVGRAGGCARSAAEVLFERESLPWDSPPRRKAGAEVAGCLETVTGDWSRSEPGSGLVTHTLTGEGHDASEDWTGRGVPLVPIQPVVAGFKRGQGAAARSDGFQIEQAPTLTSSDSGTQQSPGVMIGPCVRRMTPRECERLQGFPDDWTRWRANGSEIADGPRYRMCGNAVTVNVAEWIGRRICEERA